MVFLEGSIITSCAVCGNLDFSLRNANDGKTGTVFLYTAVKSNLHDFNKDLSTLLTVTSSFVTGTRNSSTYHIHNERQLSLRQPVNWLSVWGKQGEKIAGRYSSRFFTLSPNREPDHRLHYDYHIASIVASCGYMAGNRPIFSVNFTNRKNPAKPNYHMSIKKSQIYREYRTASHLVFSKP